MVQTVAATAASVKTLKENFGLELALDPDSFSEWRSPLMIAFSTGLHWIRKLASINISIDKNGVFCSKVLPGLWPVETALVAENLVQV
ncbi:MAG: hypothetical protein AAF685_12545 [Cyanobacteria bacterium P01_C01_bin.89]